MSDAHKAALAEGRKQSRAVRSYLEALEARPTRRRSPEKIHAKLEAVVDEQAQASAVRRVALIQQRLDLEAELAASSEVDEFEAIEAAFVEQVQAYSERKGITWSAWTEFGVPAAVLRRGGMSPARRS